MAIMVFPSHIKEGDDDCLNQIVLLNNYHLLDTALDLMGHTQEKEMLSKTWKNYNLSEKTKVIHIN